MGCIAVPAYVGSLAEAKTSQHCRGAEHGLIGAECGVAEIAMVLNVVCWLGCRCALELYRERNLGHFFFYVEHAVLL
eukprot:421304-Pelagomonas_calceolata.AAC.1